jgi:Flp pilus assembly protein TadD
MRGDVDAAIAHWERMKEVTGWHIHAENIARVSLGRGDLERASAEIAIAIATGHTCQVALQGRAELRLLLGDRKGAIADAERALACTPLEWRHLSDDTLALLAGLAGKQAEARTFYERLLARQKLSKNGQARISKVMTALEL